MLRPVDQPGRAAAAPASQPVARRSDRPFGPLEAWNGWPAAAYSPPLDRTSAFQVHALLDEASELAEHARHNPPRGMRQATATDDDAAASGNAAPGLAAYHAQLASRVHFAGPVRPIDLWI